MLDSWRRDARERRPVRLKTSRRQFSVKRAGKMLALATTVQCCHLALVRKTKTPPTLKQGCYEGGARAQVSFSSLCVSFRGQHINYSVIKLHENIPDYIAMKDGPCWN